MAYISGRPFSLVERTEILQATTEGVGKFRIGNLGPVSTNIEAFRK